MKKLFTMFAVIASLFGVLAVQEVSTAPVAEAAKQNPGQTYSGYAPVPGGDWTSGCIVEIFYSSAVYGLSEAFHAQIRGYDNSLYSNCDNVCVAMVLRHTVTGQFWTAPTECTSVGQGSIAIADNDVGLVGTEWTLNGAYYNTTSDYAQNWRSWANTV